MIYDLLGDLCSHALGLLVQRGISLVNSAALVTISWLSDLSEFLSPFTIYMCAQAVHACVVSLYVYAFVHVSTLVWRLRS